MCYTVMLIMLVMMMWCHIVTLWGEKLCKRVASPSRFDFNLLHHGDKMWLNLLIACVTTYAYVTWERNCHICQKMLFWFSTCKEMTRVIICWSISKLWHISFLCMRYSYVYYACDDDMCHIGTLRREKLREPVASASECKQCQAVTFFPSQW